MIVRLAALMLIAVLAACAEPPKGKTNKDQSRVKQTQVQPRTDEFVKVKQWLWPQKPQPWPSAKKSQAKAVTPKPEPVIKPAAAPKAAEVAVVQRPPPAPAAAEPRKKKRGAKASGSAAGQPKPQKIAIKDDGPDLPWPCWLVKAHAAGKSRAQLEAEGRAHGISLSAKQRRQAAACLR